VDIWNDDEGGILKEEGEETRKRWRGDKNRMRQGIWSDKMRKRRKSCRNEDRLRRGHVGGYDEG
jgi:hypothetical protein